MNLMGAGRLFLAVGLLAAIIAGAVFYYIMPLSPVGQPLLVDFAQAPDGGQVLVQQKFTGTLEPYEVSLYVKPAGAPQWYWFYLDHEALYWRARVIFDKESGLARILKEGRVIAELDWRTLRLKRMDVNRVVQGPQGVLVGEPLDSTSYLRFDF